MVRSFLNRSNPITEVMEGIAELDIAEKKEALSEQRIRNIPGIQQQTLLNPLFNRGKR